MNKSHLKIKGSSWVCTVGNFEFIENTKVEAYMVAMMFSINHMGVRL